MRWLMALALFSCGTAHAAEHFDCSKAEASRVAQIFESYPYAKGRNPANRKLSVSALTIMPHSETSCSVEIKVKDADTQQLLPQADIVAGLEIINTNPATGKLLACPRSGPDKPLVLGCPWIRLFNLPGA